MVTHEIPKSLLGQLEKKVARLVRRAAKLGVPPLELKVVREWNRKVFRGETQEWTGKYQTMVEVEVAGEPPKLNDWGLVARLQHTHAGNVIQVVPEQELPIKFREVTPWCDHCCTKRLRKDTFVVRHIETLEYKQVGSNCLKDFLGHNNPRVFEYYMNGMREIDAFFDTGRPGYGIRDDFVIDLRHYLAWVVLAIREFGWVPKKDADELTQPTATTALELMDDCGKAFQAKKGVHWDECCAEADAVMLWGKGLAEREKDLARSDYLYNLSVLFKLEVCDPRTLGFAASAVAARNREVERERERNKKVAQFANSEHVGEVKKREVFTLTLISKRYLESNFGVTVLHKFSDEKGNLLVWFGGQNLAKEQPDERLGTILVNIEEGETAQVKATVKEHSEFRGTKQTIINRCKVVA